MTHARADVRYFPVVPQNAEVAHYLLPNSNSLVKAIDSLDEVRHCAPHVLEYLNSIFSCFGGKSERSCS